MPFVKRVNTKAADELLEQLAAVGAECDTLEASLRAAQDRRDELVRRATAAGATRRDVAQAAKVTAGRVQQLVRRD